MSEFCRDVIRFPLPQDLDPQEIGGFVYWTAPAIDKRVELYRLYVANSPTGPGMIPDESDTFGLTSDLAMTKTCLNVKGFACSVDFHFYQ